MPQCGMEFEIHVRETTTKTGSDMDVIATTPLNSDGLPTDGHARPAAGLRDDTGEARASALDASGPLWPLALNGWMSLDRLPARLLKAIRAHALAEATAVPAPRSGATP